MAYLKINGVEYKNGITFESDLTTYNLLPSMVRPTIDILKNAERSINGTMNIDIIGRKKKLEVVFSLLENIEFEKLMEIFNSSNSTMFEIEYYGNSKLDRRWYVDEIDYQPYMIGTTMRWQNVTIIFAEI